MGTLPGTEIVLEEVGEHSKLDENASGLCILKSGQKHSIKEDINRLFEAIDKKGTRESLRKSAMKRPIRASSAIEISESTSLKQSLRGLCISQASEMATLKRLSKASWSSGFSDAGTIKRFSRAVVTNAGKSVHPLNENKANLVLIPESRTSKLSVRIPAGWHASEMEQSNQNIDSSVISCDTSTEKTEVAHILNEKDNIASLPSDVDCETLKTELVQNVAMKSKLSSFSKQTNAKLPVPGEIILASVDDPIKSSEPEKALKSKIAYASSPFNFDSDNNGNKSTSGGFCVSIPIFRSKTLFKMKTNSSGKASGGDQNGLGSGTSKMVFHTTNCGVKSEGKGKGKGKEKTTAKSSSTNVSSNISSSSTNYSVNKSGFSSNSSKRIINADERSTSKDKGDSSQCSTSSFSAVVQASVKRAGMSTGLICQKT